MFKVISQLSKHLDSSSLSVGNDVVAHRRCRFTTDGQAHAETALQVVTTSERTAACATTARKIHMLVNTSGSTQRLSKRLEQTIKLSPLY